jgi:hypothetical protein
LPVDSSSSGATGNIGEKGEAVKVDSAKSMYIKKAPSSGLYPTSKTAPGDISPSGASPKSGANVNIGEEGEEVKEKIRLKLQLKP